MSRYHFEEILSRMASRKAELLYEIEKELSFLKEQNIDVGFDITHLKRNTSTFSRVNKSHYLKLRDKLAEINFIDTITPLIHNMPVSNGTSFYNRANINIGIIADEFLYNSFKDIANFYYVEKDRYEDLKGKIDILLIASAWKGIKGDWKGMGNPKISKMRKTIFKMIDFFKNDGVKIVFYSKEDPTNYEYFVDIAQRCDYIFTTAEEKVEDYKRDCNNENVFVLEFGFNPLYNNPIGMKELPPVEGVMFAGSWYEKYPERQRDTRILFDGVINANEKLKIFDRNYELKLEQHFFPVEYLRNISPGVDHETLQNIIKLYEWIINLNTVKGSSTMFANRVYELQAMGNLILSNYSLGINNYFPNIFMVFDKDEIGYILKNYTSRERYQHRLFGIRQVFRNHTTYHRIDELLTKIGYQVNLVENKKIAVIVDEKTEKINKMFDYQTYENKVLLSKEEAINSSESFHFVAMFHNSHFYGEYYLEDMINAFKYTDADYVTKDSYYDGENKIEGIENNFINHINNVYCTVFSLDKYNLKDILNGSNLDQSNGYSSDSLEFNISEEPKYIANDNKKFTVIIPTYNNGQHLYGKCFMSLRRSSMFDNMEIIIVDDGSRDKETLMIINRLERQYSNVRVYKFGDGGSGSASRPRNKGVELSTTNYITFLDPDNEAINDGYAKLYSTLTENDYDLVIGNIKKCDTGEHDFNYYNDVLHYEKRTEFYNPNAKEFLSNTYFKAQSIQALMVKKQILEENNLQMVEGAIGEDTLFFHQLISSVKSFKVINEMIHIYYAGVEGSTVNSISVKTFERYQRLEEEKINFLRKNQLLDAYLEKRFNYYFKNWYLKKLEMVNPDSYDQASKILQDIYNLYHQHMKRNQIDSELKTKISNLANN
ncbi:hypothetical protein GCM10010978_28010 [Compostibacillus humi]|uniref:Glycosyltransferase 2-like domain-containing protein n=1 Tax=Compostibacillus humi TaxID=1245525 RepID=A0A8J2TQE9_9BACI|nr:glycosyltransferase [Compostibacillus humi]GFZ86520.1 hypothetical protein GCM10010978_28010 [Compostibacillus humi]